MLERSDHPKNAYAWMDVFRTLAAGLVAISHVRDMLWRDAAPTDGPAWKMFYLLTGFGHIGVVVFFVLSGFWISRSVMKRIDRPGFWANYLVDRLTRLWIVLVPVLILGGALDWLGTQYWLTPNYMAMSGMHSVPEPISHTLNISGMLGSLLFLAKIAIPPFGSNGPLWSLGYEFWYYLWFPALALLMLRRRVSASLLVLAIALVSGDLAFGFLSWLAGSTLHFILAREHGVDRRRWERPVFAASFLLFLALLLGARLIQRGWMDPILAAGFALFLYGLCRANLRFPALLGPVETFGSKSSFSLYALHFPVAMALTAWLAHGQRGEPSALLLAKTMGIMAALFAVAFGFSRLTEMHTDRIRGAIKRAMVTRAERRMLARTAGEQA